MNYFELLGIPETFFPDEELLRTNYYHFSRLFHPDLQKDSSDKISTDSLENSSKINLAYQTLSKFNLRLPYLLSLKGINNQELKTELDPNFLMEMMDINESLMEAKLNSDETLIQTITNEINDLNSRISEKIKSLCLEFDATHEFALLESINELNLRSKYLNRLIAQL